jgi:hypothetical protein
MYEPAASKVYEGWFINGLKDTGSTVDEVKKKKKSLTYIISGEHLGTAYQG